MEDIKKYKLTKKDISFLLENPWVDPSDLYNLTKDSPIKMSIFDNEEDPPNRLLRMLKNPDYFSFTCKHILNVDLLPFQAMILKELWIRPFPLLIGSRGLSKCENGKSIIMSDDRITTIEDFVEEETDEMKRIPSNQYLFGENGFKKVEYSWNNGITDNIKIKTQFGYHLEGTPNHPIRVVENDKIVWKNLENLKEGDKIVIDRTDSWFPNCNDLPSDLAYLFGLLVGNGGYTVRGQISFTTADLPTLNLLNEIALKYFGKIFRKQESSDYHYLLCSVKVWDDLFNKYGFESPTCHKKCFPKSVLSASKESVAAFISGLMDTDGTASKDGLILQFSSKSPKLAKMLHFVLTRFGIISNYQKRWNKEFQRYYYHVTIFGKNAVLFNEKIGFKLPRKNNKLDNFAKTINCNTNLDTIPSSLIQNLLVGLKYNKYRTKTYEMTYERLARLIKRNKDKYYLQTYQDLISLFNKNYYYDKIVNISSRQSRTYDVHIPDDHSFISNGIISHNSFLLGTYAVLRALLDQGSKVVICGSGFRQAKLVFQYSENIWNNSLILRDICKGEHKNGVARDQDHWSIRIGKSVIFGIPLGDGCVSPYTLITYDDCIDYIARDHDIHFPNKEVVVRDRNCYGNFSFNLSDESYCNAIKPVKVISTKKGLEFIATHNHKIKTVENTKIVWKRMDEMKIGDPVLIDRSKRWHNGDQTDISIENAYALGIMIGLGNWLNEDFFDISTDRNDLLEALKVNIGEFKGKSKKKFLRGHNIIDKWIDFWDLRICEKSEKHIPKKMLSCNKEKMKYCLRGIFESLINFDKLSNKKDVFVDVRVNFSSKELVQQIQYILLHFGIVSSIFVTKVANNCATYCMILGNKELEKFIKEIGFSEHINNKIISLLSEKKRLLSRSDYIPTILDKTREFVKNNRERKNGSDIDYCDPYILSQKKGINFKVANKLLDIYSHLDDEFISDLKILANEDIYYDEIKSIEDGESVTYDIHIPETHEYCANGFFSHNSKIRGFRATDIIMDEFASVDPNIYQNVIQGFAAVSSSPVENVKKLARNKLIEKYKIDVETDNYIKPNRQILSGTAYYEFNHFATYWKRWRSIIQTKGDPDRLKLLFPEGLEDGFDWRDYSIVRIPVELIPEGYMDVKAVGKAKISSHIGNYLIEYGAVFVSDSDGFFKRSLIESCVAKGDNIKPPVGPIQYSPLLSGASNKKYVIAIDPASEQDNFAIIVLELHDNHKRIVYCWTTNKARYGEAFKKKLTSENDFYVFCAKKIRELRYKFPCNRIAMDEEGGGRAVAEALRDPKNLDDPSHQLILPIIEEDKEKPTDNIPGEHILELINFSRYEWVSEANHTLRKDLEDKTLLFPFYDNVSLGIAAIEDSMLNREYDTLEDCTQEIEELKDELATITITRTPNNNRDRWDTPDTKLPGGKKGKQRKDRYTALLIANMAARGVQTKQYIVPHTFIGGFASNFGGNMDGGPLFSGPLWYLEEAKKSHYWD